MDEFIKHSLDSIEQCARQIVTVIRGIYGYCNGMDTVANSYPCISALPQNNLYQGNGFGDQPHNLLEEIKAMIVELKIKGSVRERANGLIEFRTQALGSIYGRSRIIF